MISVYSVLAALERLGQIIHHKPVVVREEFDPHLGIPAGM
jgi:hypothetical protein